MKFKAKDYNIIIGLIALLYFMGALFPATPGYSAAFDCDDGAMLMYQHFNNMGYPATPFVGNLEISGESYSESNHVWLMVVIQGHKIAYDWGKPCFDSQHYEGQSITIEELQFHIEKDKRGQSDYAQPSRD